MLRLGCRVRSFSGSAGGREAPGELGRDRCDVERIQRTRAAHQGRQLRRSCDPHVVDLKRPVPEASVGHADGELNIEPVEANRCQHRSARCGGFRQFQLSLDDGPDRDGMVHAPQSMVGEDHPDTGRGDHQVIDRLAFQVGIGQSAVKNGCPPRQFLFESGAQSAFTTRQLPAAAIRSPSVCASMEHAGDPAIDSHRRREQQVAGAVGTDRHEWLSTRCPLDSKGFSESPSEPVR